MPDLFSFSTGRKMQNATKSDEQKHFQKSRISHSGSQFCSILGASVPLSQRLPEPAPRNEERESCPFSTETEWNKMHHTRSPQSRNGTKMGSRIWFLTFENCSPQSQNCPFSTVTHDLIGRMQVVELSIVWPIDPVILFDSSVHNKCESYALHFENTLSIV